MKQTKIKPLSRVLAALALFLSVCLMGTSVLRVFANENTVYASNAYVRSDEQDVIYTEGARYSVSVTLETDVPVASYQLNVRMPDFVRVLEVNAMRENDATYQFVSEIDASESAFNVTCVSGTNFTNDTLFEVVYTLPQGVTASGVPSVTYSQFTNAAAQYVEGFNFELGVINARANSTTPDVSRAKGDVNGDGEINLADLMRIQRSLVNAGTEALIPVEYTAADIDESGTVDMRDCQYVMMYITGAITSFDGIGGAGGSDDKDGEYSYTVVAYDYVNKMEMATTTVIIYQGEYVGQRVSEMFTGTSVNGFYFDMEGKTPVMSQTAPTTERTVYVFVQTGEVNPPVNPDMVSFQVTLNYENLDGSASSREEMGGRQSGQLVSTLKDQYSYYNGKNYEIMVFADAAMTQAVSFDTVLENGAHYYLQLVEFTPVSVNFVMITNMNGTLVPVTGFGSSYKAGKNIYAIVEEEFNEMSSDGMGMSDYYTLNEVYNDSALQNKLSEDAVVAQDGVYYVLVSPISLAGSYPLVDEEGASLGVLVLDDMGNATIQWGATLTEEPDVTQPPESSEEGNGGVISGVVGNVGLTGTVVDGTLSGAESGSGEGTQDPVQVTSETGTYGMVEGMAFVTVSAYKQYIIMVAPSYGMAMLYASFDGTDYEEAEEFRAAQGKFTVTATIEDFGMTLVYDIELYANGVCKLSIGSMAMICSYFYSGDVYTLVQMGDYTQMIKQEDGNFIPSEADEHYYNYYNQIDYNLRLFLAGVCQMSIHDGATNTNEDYVGTYVREGDNATITLENGTVYKVTLYASDSEYGSAKFTFEGQPVEDTSGQEKVIIFYSEDSTLPVMKLMMYEDGYEAYGSAGEFGGSDYYFDGETILLIGDTATAYEIKVDDTNAILSVTVFDSKEGTYDSVASIYEMNLDGMVVAVELQTSGMAVIRSNPLQIYKYSVLSETQVEFNGITYNIVGSTLTQA